MSYAIDINNACKQFGSNLILDNASLKIEYGVTCGLIGRNGSGKTVLMKCICGIMPLNSGEIKVYGKLVGKNGDTPKNIGVIIETPGFLSEFSAYSNLKFLSDISGKANKQAIYSSIRKVGLNPSSKKHVGRYSLGMRQRLGLAQAIMENPDLLILAEPMNGLDKDGVADMRKYLLDLKAEGKTILIASHSAEDIDILCDTVYEMDKGKLQKVR